MSRSSATPDENNESSKGESLLEKVMQSTNNNDIEATTKHHNVTFSITTPMKSPSKRAVFDKVNSPGRSPGGYDILKALDGVSDFTQTFYNMKEDNEDDDIADDKQSQEDTGYRVARIVTKATPLHFANDHEYSDKNVNSLDAIIEETKMGTESTSLNTSFYQEPIGINLLDWSLKKRVRILCSAGSLPGTVISAFSRDRRKWPPPDDGLVQQLGIHYLANSANKSFEEGYGRQPTLEEMAMAKWIAAKMYYQHPAVHPLPLSALMESKKNNKAPNQNDPDTVPSLASFNNRSTYQRVRLPGIGSMGGLGTSERLHKNIIETNSSKTTSPNMHASFPSMIDKRVTEWHETFRSMYQCWRSKLTVLEKQFADKNKRVPTPDEVSRCCFYSISPSQVVLFRVGLLRDNKPFPVIAFSSTTVELREKVKSMGANLKLLRPNKSIVNGSSDVEETFSEDILGHSKPQAPESQGEAADLRALREANNSSTRSTEVEVTQKKKLQSGKRASSIPPLYVSGDEDCAVVYELLLNTCGFSLSGSYGNWQMQHDVPLLLCRSIGPCLNTVLKTLSVSACRDNAYWYQLNGQGNQSEQSYESVMELYGPVLPCSIRDMMCSAINFMVLDQKLDEYKAFDAPTQPINGKSNTESESKVEHSQVSMFLQTHEGEFPDSVPTSTGSASSYLFNNGSNISFSENKNEMHECIKGEGLNSLIWNASHSAELSYNTFFTS
jgi:hypothetical protein